MHSQEMHQNINRFIVKLRIKLMKYMIPIILPSIHGIIRMNIFPAQQSFMKKEKREMQILPLER